MSGDIFGSHNLRLLLASSGQRSGTLSVSYSAAESQVSGQCIGQPPRGLTGIGEHDAARPNIGQLRTCSALGISRLCMCAVCLGAKFIGLIEILSIGDLRDGERSWT